MATLIDTPAPIDGPLSPGGTGSWTANETYKIAAADLVEGAQGGASFSGLGIDNEPHQQLANRTSRLWNMIQRFATRQLATAPTGPVHGEHTGALSFPMTIGSSTVDVLAQYGIVSFPQWGNGRSDNVVGNSFTFAFGTACFIVLVSPAGNPVVDFTVGLRHLSVGLSGFSVNVSVLGLTGITGTITRSANYIALGY